MTLPLYLAFIAAAVFLLLIPGPTVLMVVGYGLAEGRRKNWPLVIGVALGDAVALTCSVAGLGAVLAASASAFTILKYIGAVYLVYLGIGMIRSGAAAAPKLSAASPRKKFAHAFAAHKLSLYELTQKAATDPEALASLADIKARTEATCGGLVGTVVVSDGFFPFRDGVDLCIAAGVTAIAQPGGSIRDFEIIQAVNEAIPQVAMVFTGQRSFKH